MKPMSIQTQRWLMQPMIWRFVGFVSAVVGLLCYALSSSFNHLFGEWNILKIFVYVIFSFFISFLTLFGKLLPWPTTTSIRFQSRSALVVLIATSAYSFFNDKVVTQKPDAYILISCAAFAVMSLCLSKQTNFGYEVDLLNFFLGTLIILLMKKNWWLVFVGAGFSYALVSLRSYLDLQSEHFELHATGVDSEATVSTSSHAVVVGAPSFRATAAPFQKNDSKKYDVFISFRGEDTRQNFISHLHAALRRHNIIAYRDEVFPIGDEVWASLVEAIHESNVFLVIFSENYASSKWCLNELVEIMELECMEKGRHVIPVFYKIDPSRVRNQSGSYEEAFRKHEQSMQRKETIKKWKDNLIKAGNITGFDSNSRRHRDDSKLIEDICKLVLQIQCRKPSNELIGHFIENENYAQIKSLLRMESREVRIIGLWGMRGIGKTILAEAIFNEISSQFDATCFLENARDQSESHALNFIYGRLFPELMENLSINSSKVISSVVMRRLMHMKVLIVLDDVNSSELLEYFVGVRRDFLAAGSRVIATTRDKRVLRSGRVDEIHEVKQMNFSDSLQLFSFNAFKKPHPEEGYEEASKKAIIYAQGIPIALKVLGSFLSYKSENEWESALKKLQKIPIVEIQNVLRLSYDELDATEKYIFLDIACFFEGHDRDRISRVLDACGLFADIEIRNLLDKALITIHLHNCIKLHGLIKAMGREIVRCESINKPERRSRLWDSWEVCTVLTSNIETDVVESIFLDMTEIAYLQLSSYAFRKMPNLRLLAFDNGGSWGINDRVFIPKDLELPNKVRYIQWDGYPLKSLPSICWKNLADLSFPHSNLQKLWDGSQNLPRLKRIFLAFSKCLIECPDLSGARNLEFISFHGCESLGHLHPSIFSLEKLEVLDVSRCTALKSICSKTCSPSLQRLCVDDCSNIQDCSFTMSGDQCKTHLFLGQV